MPEAESSPEPKPTPRLGSYLLVQTLGSGGMSSVFRAVHEESGNIVAVKVLPRTLAKNVTLLQRFIREAKSAESLDHPNIVAIYDRGFDQGRHYLVLEFVEGRDLHDRVRLNGPLRPLEAIGFIREVAEGLRYAAGKGMIHRDVKPANLLMTPDGHAKIIDLGLALQVENEDERVTRDGTTVGTVDYMAPEQARDSRQTSERSDIYSLGCTFYYLLTGSAPFPGGDLSDKLARHFKAPIPDVRGIRPEIPENLSLLIRKMMEKKADRRYSDYTQLIAALDALDQPESVGPPGEILDALIDDEDDDEIGLAPTESAIGGRNDRPPSTRDHLLMAEIVEDDDEVDEPSRVSSRAIVPKPRSRTRPNEPSPGREPAEPAEFSLADLAALDADDPPVSRRQTSRPASSGSAVNSTTTARPASLRPPTAAFPSMPDDEADPVFGANGPPRRSSGDELPLKTWIAAGVMVGLAIAIIGFGASMLISLTKPEKVADNRERPPEESLNNETAVPPEPINRPERVNRPTPVIKKTAPLAQPEPRPAVSGPVVVEVPTEEKSYPLAWESRLAPAAMAQSLSPAADRPRVVVRRVIQAGEEHQTSSLAAALSRASDIVEIADSGPFFEDDCQVAGKSRWIRARGGVRPMIKIEFAVNEIIKEQTAKFILGGSKVDQLVLEGLDIAVDVRDLPDHQKSLFLCQGAELILRDCSLTILNANDANRTNRFSIFRVEDGAKPNRIVLERTTIRGPVRTLVDVVAARAEIIFDRSLLLGDTTPLIVAEAAEKAVRSITFHRSLVVTRGSVVELSGRSSPLMVRSLGTTFAKTEPANASSLFASKAAIAGDPPTVLDWLGEDNEFVGWPGWLSAGSETSVRVTGIGGVRSTWPGTDASSREVTSAWPALSRPDEIVPGDFARLAPDRRPSLVKMAIPHPKIKELTVGSLARLPTPELSVTLIPPFQPPAAPFLAVAPAMAPKPAPSPPQNPNATGPRRKNLVGMTPGPVARPIVPGPLNLIFNVQEAPWAGDLGLYLAEKLVEGTTRATILVKGSGIHATTPIRLPDGLSITILGDSVEGSNLPMPTFVTRSNAAGRSMIELHGGDLAIANLAFSTEGSTRPLHWVRAEDSLLAIRHCRFRDPASQGIARASVGPLISFIARGTAPIAPRIGPFTSATDRPTARLKNCVLWTAGEAISLEVGRGVVDLENCLIISAGPAITLLPQNVARDKFEADLVLDRCTIAVDRTSILLGPLAGEPTGPTRPWLVSTRRCAFPKTQTGGAGALLQVDPDSMARGTLFWISVADAYEGARFVAPTGLQPANLPPADLKRQWIDLWGHEHTKGDQGPNPRRNDSVLRYKDKERPKPGKVLPGALELDSKLQKDLGVDFKDLPRA